MTDAQADYERFHQARERIQQGIVERGIPSLTVAVSQGDTILWEEGFGWTDRERRIAATPHTLYSLGSISKPIAATALMILKERGLLGLDQPINKYLSDSKLRAWVGNADDATVRRVANHTSGLPAHYQFFYQDEPYPIPPMDETIGRYGNLVTAPGERFTYSNLGYGLLSEIITRLSGQSYADFLRQEVFLPLGMLHSSVNVGPGLEPFQAQRYSSGGVLYPFYEANHLGASAIYASAHDLMRFCWLHLKQLRPDQKAILSGETLDEMQTPTARQSATLRYGVGLRIYDEAPDLFIFGHSGGMDGVNTLLKMIPAARIAIAILTNTNENRDLEDQIVEDILAVLFPPYTEKRANEKARQAADQTAMTDFSPSSDLLGQWQGYVHTYEGDIPFMLWFKESGDVHAQLGTQLKTLVNKVQYKEQFFEGLMMGNIGTRDASRYPHNLTLDLKLRDDRLTGAVIVMPIIDRTAGHRLGQCLSHWAELKKVLP